MLEQDVDGVKQRIIAAGRTEFARSGLEAASVRAIGDGAGVTAAMINYYFGGKRGLYQAVVAEAQGRLLERLGAAVEPGQAGLAPRLAGAYFDFLAEDQELQRLLMREVMDQGEGTRSLASDYVQPLRAVFERHFGKSPEALQLAVSLFGVVAGYFLYAPVLGAFLDAEPYSPDALARRRRHVLSLAALFEELPR
jgi:AcrR family transcriptional regulator